MEERLFNRIESMNKAGTKTMIRTWSRTSTIFPEFVGHTIAVHDGRKHIPVFVSRVDGRPQARRVRPDPHVPRARRRRQEGPEAMSDEPDRGDRRSRGGSKAKAEPRRRRPPRRRSRPRRRLRRSRLPRGHRPKATRSRRPPRRRSRPRQGQGEGQGQARARRAAAAATPTRTSSCAPTRATCARRPARPAWSATTSAASPSTRRARSSPSRPATSPRPGASCSSPPSPTRRTTTTSTRADLKITAVFADEGPTLKRFRPRAMGRATRIRKRTSHLTIHLTPKG